MMPLGLFASRNFAAGNLTTLLLYAGLGVATFFLVLFLQQVGGYRPVAAGLALLPLTLLMFTLSRRFGALADRIGPHRFMAGGPIVAGIGLLLLVRVDAHADYLTQVLPGGARVRARPVRDRRAAHRHRALRRRARPLRRGQRGQQRDRADRRPARDRRARRRRLRRVRRPARSRPRPRPAQRRLPRRRRPRPHPPAGDRRPRGRSPPSARWSGPPSRTPRCTRSGSG